MNKGLTIAAVIIVLIGIAVGVYFLFFNTGGGITTENGFPGDPFGAPSGDVTPGGIDTSGGNTTDTGETVTQVAPRLVKIAAKPVAAGAIILDPTPTPVVSLASTTATTTPPAPTGVEVRYIDRESGNMYVYKALDGATERLTNRTIPGAQEAAWLPDGKTAFVRISSDDSTTEHIETYALPADGSEGFFLSRDLAQVIPVGTTTIFTFLPSSSGSIGVVGRADGSNAATLFSSPMSALTLSGSTNNFVAYTKPSNRLAGYAFLVGGKSGGFTKLLGPTPGLAAIMSPSGQKILFSNMRNGSLQMGVMDVGTHAITTLPNQTFVEKCVWTPDNTAAYCAVPTSFPSATYPDDWYQGVVSFSDRIWKIDFTARVATLVANLPDLAEDEPIDAVSLTLDPNGSTLVFQNKRDGSLWAYSL